MYLYETGVVFHPNVKRVNTLFLNPIKELLRGVKDDLTLFYMAQ